MSEQKPTSRTCDCEPFVHPDGSKTHEDDCPVYPWCPHEVGAWSCPMPCNCSCVSCRELSDGHEAAKGSSTEVRS